MGYGDDIITTALVKRAFAMTNQKVRPGNGASVEWSDLFDNNPKMCRHKGPWLKSYTGARPYILYDKSDKLHFEWNYSFKVEPGEIFFWPDEKSRWQSESGFVYIEPNIKKALGNSNKDWGFDKWQEAVYRLSGYDIVQAKYKPVRPVLQGVRVLETNSFRDACSLLSRAKLFLGTDSGLHHAAAALGIPAVVVWGGFAPPSVLGYDSHTNLCAARSWCGSFANCPHCRQAMDAITVEMVVDAVHNAIGALSREAA